MRSVPFCSRTRVCCVRAAVRDSQCNRGRRGNPESGLRKRSGLTSGKGGFPTKAARRDSFGARTALAVKGSLRRAPMRRALDGCGPFWLHPRCDGRLRRENHNTWQGEIRQRFVSDPPGVPRRNRDCNREPGFLMCHTGCFEAGRFPQTQSSRTALSCSRKWMSGRAHASTQSVTDRNQQIVVQYAGSMALQESLPSAGEVLFLLDKSLSWMSPFPPVSALLYGMGPV